MWSDIQTTVLTTIKMIRGKDDFRKKHKTPKEEYKVSKSKCHRVMDNVVG